MQVKIFREFDVVTLEKAINAWLTNDEPGTIESKHFFLESGGMNRIVAVFVWIPESMQE
jgi:hypothetical protein